MVFAFRDSVILVLNFLGFQGPEFQYFPVFWVFWIRIPTIMYCQKKNCASEREKLEAEEKLLKFKAKGREFASERSEQFLKQNVFLTYSLRFLRSNKFEQLQFKLVLKSCWKS